MMKTRQYIYGFLVLLFLCQCSKEKVPKAYRPTHAHALYSQSLEDANLSETALGRDWISASKAALKNPITIHLPFEEVFYVDSTDAFAVGYRFDVKRGRRIDVDLTMENRRSIRIFMDLFRVPADSSHGLSRVASANGNETRLEFEPTRDYSYILRIQPELLRGGLCRIVIRQMPSLAFPVPDKDKTSILSFFGDPRDGGRRVHHGVDIFASRHTAVIAPAGGMVRHTGETEIGGNVVWVWDNNRALYYYFAHLQDFNVQKNDLVIPGQKLGTVGNSGNARTTPPHLHFGIYAPGNGPVDPYYFITRTDTVPEKILADLTPIGSWVRANHGNIDFKTSTGLPDTTMTIQSSMKIMAASRNLYRVSIPNGVPGYVHVNHVEPSGKPLYCQTDSLTLLRNGLL